MADHPIAQRIHQVRDHKELVRRLELLLRRATVVNTDVVTAVDFDNQTTTTTTLKGILLPLE